MKRKLLVTLLTLLLAFCSLGLIGCGEDGKYYLYENGKFNKKYWVLIDGDYWEDDEGESGRVEIDDEKITFYIEFFGQEEELFKGTIKDGCLTLDIMGSKTTYYKEDATINVLLNTNSQDGKFSVSNKTEVGKIYVNTLEYEGLHENYLLNNVGISVKTEITIDTQTKGEKEVYTGTFNGIHDNNDKSNPYKFAINLSSTINDKKVEKKVYYDSDKLFALIDDGTTTTKTFEEIPYEASLKSGFSIYLSELSLGYLDTEILNNVATKSNVTYEINTTDENITKIKISYIETNYIENGKKITSKSIIYAYNTDYELIAVDAEIDILTKRQNVANNDFEPNDYITIKYTAIPWKGTVSLPNDLNTYINANA